CNFTTHYDLLAPGGMRRQLISPSAPPDGWNAASYDDSGWASSNASVQQLEPMGDGTMPAVYVRQRFELGPSPSRYKKLVLKFRVGGSYRAFINGHELTPEPAGSTGRCSLVLDAGMVGATDNVLALAIFPTVPTIALDTRLDGDRGPAAPNDIVKGPYLLRT